MTLKPILTASVIALALASGSRAIAETELDFYFPVAIGGPVTQIIEDLTSRFEAEHPGITVNPIYAGTYPETLSKALTAYHSGQPPAIAVMLSTELHSLLEEEALLPIEDFLQTDEDRAWLDGFMPVYMENSRAEGKTWGIPFQRGATLFFWNKDAFREAGLDPEVGPKTWDEVVSFAQKLTLRNEAGDVSRWGMQVPSSLTSYWLLQGYVQQLGGAFFDPEGKKTWFDAPETIAALQFWVDLAAKHKVMKTGVIEWATNPKDFFEGKAAMITTTSGNLTNIRNNAPFDFGVQMLPAAKTHGAPTSGGNAFIFAGLSDDQSQAAFELVKWLSEPEQAAEWSIKTGYVAARQDAWDTEAMQAYLAEFPAAGVALEQIPYMTPELATYENQRIARVIDDAIEAALTGGKTVEAALSDAQAEADRILKRYRD